jgi:hypothetical protein
MPRSLLADPIAKLLESLQDIPPLGPKPTAFPSDVEKTAVAIVLRLKEPRGVVERLSPGCQEDGLDVWEGLGDSWAHWGSWTAYSCPEPPHEEVLYVYCSNYSGAVSSRRTRRRLMGRSPLPRNSK